MSSGERLLARLKRELSRLRATTTAASRQRVFVLAASDANDTLREQRERFGLTKDNKSTGTSWVEFRRPPPWAAELSPPLTVEAALVYVEGKSELLAAQLWETIRSFAEVMISPRLMKHSLGRAEIVDSWPWPQDEEELDPAWKIFALLREHLSAEPQPNWPAHLAPLEVATWARAPLNRLYEGFGDAFLEEVSADIIPAAHAMSFRPSTINGSISAYAVALLYQAERRARVITPTELTAPKVDVSNPTVDSLTSLVGASPHDPDPRKQAKRNGSLSRKLRGDQPVGMIFRWDDGTERQLDLPLDDPAAGILEVVAQQYGDAAVRDILVMFFFAWARHLPPATSDWWWWPDEHLDVAGLSVSKDSRKALLTKIGRLNRTRLEAHYDSGSPLVGPMIRSGGLTDGTARLVGIHPALYSGVRQLDGEAGKYWWPIPMAVLKAKASGTRIHALAVIAGGLFRQRLPRLSGGNPQYPEITAARLAYRLNLSDRASRSSADLRSDLEVGRATDLLDYTIKHGALEDMSATLILKPGKEAMRIIETGDHPWPAWLPSTGTELAAWMNRGGLTSASAGEILSVPASTLRRVAGYGPDRPLPDKIRTALRRHLWVSQ